MSLMWMMPAFTSQGTIFSLQGWSPLSRTADAQESQSAYFEIHFEVDGGIRTRHRTVSVTNIYTDVCEWSSAHPNEQNAADWSIRVSYSSGLNREIGRAHV